MKQKHFQKILIVEDEIKLASLISDYLKQAGFDTKIIDNGLQVVDWVRQESPDLILLDLMLPGKDGIEICKEVRLFSQVPILMLTARIEEIDRLLGLALGADDYICKPYSPREVLARIKAVSRRCGGEIKTPTEQLLLLDEQSFSASIKGNTIALTVVEFQLLKILLEQPQRIHSRGQLMDQIYDDERIVSERTIDCHIKKLRKKLHEILPGTEVIHAVYGVGYKVELDC